MHAKMLRATLRLVILSLTLIAPGSGVTLKATEPGSNLGNGLLLVANKGNQTLEIIDPFAGRQIAVIDLKNWKVEKLINPGPGTDGLAWARGE